MHRARKLAAGLPVRRSTSSGYPPLRPVGERSAPVTDELPLDGSGGSELEEMSDLIGHIYDVTLDPSLWPRVLTSIMTFVGGQAAGLLSKDAVSKAGDIHHHVGVDEHYVDLDRETYWRYDPMAALAFQKVGQVVSRGDYISEEEHREGRFFREWLQPQGWVDAANVLVEKSTTSLAVLSVVRRAPAGPVDDTMRTRMGLIFPPGFPIRWSIDAVDRQNPQP